MSDTAESSIHTDGDPYRQSVSPGSSAPQPHPQSAQDLVKVTRGTSCVLCQQRKVRCDKNKPCSNCVKAGVECRVIPPQPPRRRKKRISERDLVARLRKYEALLVQHGVEFESLGPDIKVTDPGTVHEGDELDTDFRRVRDLVADSLNPELISSPGENPHMPKTFKWFPFQKEFRALEQPLQDSSDEDDVGSGINHAYDKMFENSDGFPFLVGGGAESVADQHPPALHIIQLWQVYLNNVNPLLKLTHTPTLQERIVDATANIGKVSKSLEALMFAIYFMAVTSMTDQEVQLTFEEDKGQLQQRYYTACQQALINGGFMRNPDLTLLQAFLLYLMGIRHYMDPRSLFCLTGIAVRLAYRMGIHRDGADFHLAPFEVEERRRLWWTLVSFDRRIGEMTGSTITAISNGGDCKLPLNINDADLHLHAKDPPNPHVGATEMVFALTRLEFARAPGSDKMKAVLSDASPQVPNVADHRMINYIERMVTHLEDTYLKHCDPKIPLQYFALTMTRASVCKLRVISGFFKIATTAPQALSLVENETLFIESIKMIEYDSMIQANESLRGFRWFTLMHFPFPAYVALAKELRTRTSGELCERAWQAMIENHECRGITKKMRSPMHLAFTPLFLKAWAAREAHEASQGRTLAPPQMIIGMRQLAARLGLKENSKSPEARTPLMTPRSFSSPEAELNPETPNMQPYQPTNTAWTSAPPMDLNGGQYAGAFADVNFGGEVDWNFLFQQYSGIQPMQPAPPPTQPPPPPQMPVNPNGVYSVWQ
ncbi:putative Fungal-specific transcription factor domain-containing protein [Seiridium cardinale]